MRKKEKGGKGKGGKEKKKRKPNQNKTQSLAVPQFPKQVQEDPLCFHPHATWQAANQPTPDQSKDRIDHKVSTE